MKTNYDAKQKCVFMTIALMASVIMLGLNACQKEATSAKTVTPVIADATDSATETSPGASEIAETVKASMHVVNAAVGAAGEKSAAAYQEVVQRLDRSVDQGVDAYAIQRQETEVRAALDQTIMMRTDG